MRRLMDLPHSTLLSNTSNPRWLSSYGALARDDICVHVCEWWQTLTLTRCSRYVSLTPVFVTEVSNMREVKLHCVLLRRRRLLCLCLARLTPGNHRHISPNCQIVDINNSYCSLFILWICILWHRTNVSHCEWISVYLFCVCVTLLVSWARIYVLYLRFWLHL